MGKRTSVPSSFQGPRPGRRGRALLRVVVLLLALPYAVQADDGMLLRDSELHAEAGFDSAVLARLEAGSTVDVRGRNGLWMFVIADAPGGAARGWLRLTSVRLSGRAPDPAAEGGGIGSGFAAFSRSVSSLLGGLRGRETRTAHATIGIRGLTPGELETAQFDGAALSAVAAAAASPADARSFARAGGLTARRVPELAAAGDAP